MVLTMFIANANLTPILSDNTAGNSTLFSMEQKLERFMVKKNLPNSVENETYTIYLQRGDKPIFDFKENRVKVNGFSYSLKEMVYTPNKCMICLITNSDMQNSQ